jgi:hypothetical protein
MAESALSPDTKANLTELRGRVRAQIAMLVAQFLLGMAVALIGDREETWAKVSKDILLGLHVLVAIGLIVGVILTMRLAVHLSAKLQRTARVAALGVGVGVIGGILTLSAPWGDLWSFVMAVGFIVAFLFNGFLYLQTVSAAARSGNV